MLSLAIIIANRSIILIAHNLRSCHNVGSLLRTAEGLGVEEVLLSGYSPCPLATDDERLPHLAQKIDRQICKTALGAESSQPWRHTLDIKTMVNELKADGYLVCAVEQTSHCVPLPDFNPPQKLALLVGREVEGVEPEILALMDTILEIPMLGRKESFNVVQAAAMALYHCRYHAQV